MAFHHVLRRPRMSRDSWQTAPRSALDGSGRRSRRYPGCMPRSASRIRPSVAWPRSPSTTSPGSARPAHGRLIAGKGSDRCRTTCRSISRLMSCSARKHCGGLRTRLRLPSDNARHPVSRKVSQMRKENPVKTTSTAPLETRIGQLRAEIEAVIDARVGLVAAESPGVPPGVIRNLLTARAPACPCAQYLGLSDRD